MVGGAVATHVAATGHAWIEAEVAGAIETSTTTRSARMITREKPIAARCTHPETRRCVTCQCWLAR
jgi:hypothetical protein